jgi:outer membrane immunogenic protein
LAGWLKFPGAFIHRVTTAIIACVAFSLGLSQAASTADLPAKAPVYSAPAAAPAPWSWTGFYVGGNAGYAWGRADTATTVPDSFAFPFTADNLIYSAAASPTIDSKGFTSGGQIGFNYQVSNFVFGLETDYNAFRLRGSTDTVGLPVASLTTLASHTELNTDWLFTLRPRAGITIGQWLFYGTGGLATTNIKYSQTNVFAGCPPFACTESVAVSKTKTGWTAGGGVEAALFDNWSVKAEYLYVNFGSIGTTTGFDSTFATPITHDAKLQASIARLGLNYRFAVH